MAAAGLRKGNARLPPEVNRVLYVRNLPFNILSEKMYDIFGKYGAIRQIRLGNAKDTRGTQRRQPLPHRALLPARQDVQEVRRQEGGGGDH
ncbi:hypothetical protein BAE44_0018833 [Dichanthelium oligosanthes]|uniref:RRM domain-containing protein n=1 Tax=Dichanthelium oligosanthes TaxID=888268 RepID=A0A1E5V4X1_9POAL|nr:hypothetical protein BAE44_0018833 [Dichanthelium oligosanthes]